MKIFSKLSPIHIAIIVSVMFHGSVLRVKFEAPDSFQLKPVDPGLEVILVNAKHARAPLKADALAQANLDGGGSADAGRAASPLPDLHRIESGESVESKQRRIAELEQAQVNLLTQTRKALYTAKPVTEKDKPDPNRNGNDLLESSKTLARAAAEISQRVEDENKRPKKTFMSPSTMSVSYAQYYSEMTHRIEEIGTLNFPQKDGKKMYGQVIISIPVFQDGHIYDKEGGITVDKSSGNALLDAAAVAIVRRSAPFGKFSSMMMSSKGGGDVFVLTTTFKFARNDRLETEHGSVQ